MNKTNHIAIVEDDPADQALLRAGLRELDAELLFYVTAEEALRELGLKQPALLLVDIHLPGMDGFEFMAQMQLNPAAHNIPIILMTQGSHTNKEILRGYDLGAVDYLIKPIPSDILNAKVRLFLKLFEHHEELSQAVTLQKWIQGSGQPERSISSSGAGTPITQALGGSRSLKEMVPDEFEGIVRTYLRLFDRYRQGMLTKAAKPSQGMRALVRALGNYGAGPRDMMDVHIHVLDALSMTTDDMTRTQALMQHSRLFAIEMMGMLVDYYRLTPRVRTLRKRDES